LGIDRLALAATPGIFVLHEDVVSGAPPPEDVLSRVERHVLRLRTLVGSRLGARRCYLGRTDFVGTLHFLCISVIRHRIEQSMLRSVVVVDREPKLKKSEYIYELWMDCRLIVSVGGILSRRRKMSQGKS